AANFCAQPEIARLQDRQFLRDVVVKFDEQNCLARLRVEFEQITRGLEMELSFCLIEQRPIDVLDRGRLEIEQSHGRLHRVGDGCEKDEAESFLTRQGRDFELCGKNRGECPFAAGENFVEIVWRSRKSLEAITRPALE